MDDLEVDGIELEDKPKRHIFKPGQSGNPNGRPKDLLSKPNLLRRSRDLDIHPEDILLYFAAGKWKELGMLSPKDITPNMRLTAAIAALKKMVPDLKAVEHSNMNSDEENDTSIKTIVVVPSNTREHPSAIDETYVSIDAIEGNLRSIVETRLNDSE